MKLDLELEVVEDANVEDLNFKENQGHLGEVIQGGVKVNVDIVFVIDATGSMEPVINTVKDFTLNLYDKLGDALAEKGRILDKTRARVIAFRDYYCDGKYAMEESEFFELPSENKKFRDFVANIKVEGGGDIPQCRQLKSTLTIE